MLPAVVAPPPSALLPPLLPSLRNWRSYSACMVCYGCSDVFPPPLLQITLQKVMSQCLSRVRKWTIFKEYFKNSFDYASFHLPRPLQNKIEATLRVSLQRDLRRSRDTMWMYGLRFFLVFKESMDVRKTVLNACHSSSPPWHFSPTPKTQFTNHITAQEVHIPTTLISSF
jgi:hypothetical protein